MPDLSVTERFYLLPELRSAYRAIGTGTSSQSLVFVFGAAGCGKSALLRHAEADAVKSSSADRVERLTLSSWIESLAIAKQARRRTAFLRATVDLELLLLDDYDQAELSPLDAIDLLGVLDGRQRRGVRTVLAGRSLPGSVASVSAALRDRLRGSAVCEVRPLSDESVERLAMMRFERQQVVVEPSAIVALLPSLPRQVGPLFERLDLLARETRRHGGTLTRGLVMSSVRRQSKPTRVTLRECEQAVAREFEISTKRMRSNARSAHVTLPRQVAMWVARRVTSSTYETIGTHFGGRNHTTVIHACRRIERLLPDDAELSRRVQRIEASLVDADSVTPLSTAALAG